MRVSTAFLLLAAFSCPLAAQRTMDGDSGPIVRIPSAGGQRAEDRVTPSAGTLGENRLVPDFITEIHSQADDPEGGAYGIWAAGKDYKVSFHDGATYVPFLGGNYPHNQPFRWATTSITVGDEELVTREQPLGAQASGTRYEYDHGGVLEAYDVRLEGLEQTFVIPSAPDTPGDLVVRGTVDTALSAGRVVDQHTGIRFVDHNGDPILTYGAATAVDASGHTAPMTTTYAGGSFELELDGAWLSNATFPVTVDPLMQNNVLLNTWGGSFGSTTDLDVLREDQRPTDNVWICYTRQVSFSDEDLWVLRTNDNLPGSLFALAFSDITSLWGNGTCALAYADSRVICAFVRDFGNSRNIRWHAHHVNDLATRTGIGTFTTSNNNWRVDIGGNRANTGSNRAMVVFQHENVTPFGNGPESESRAFYIDLSGATNTTSQGTSADPITILAATNNDCERPRINQVAQGFGANHWCVVHQYVESNNSSDDWDAYVDIWSETGGLVAYGNIEPDNGEHKLGPVVAGAGGRYLVVYGGADSSLVGPTGTIAGYEINTQRVDFDGTSVSFPHPPNLYLTSASRILETRSVAFDSNTTSHWLSVTRFGNTLFADLLGYRGAYETYDNFIQGPSGITSVRGAACSFDRDNDTYVLVGAETQTGSHPIRGNIWSNPSILSPSVAGFGCSSASLTWAPQPLRPNSQRIGHEFSGVTLSGVPVGALSALGVSLNAVSIPIGTIPGVGTGCNQLINNNTGFLGFLPIGFGSPLGTVRWELPLNENFWPLTFHFQAFHLDASSSVFLTTQRLSVPIGY